MVVPIVGCVGSVNSVGSIGSIVSVGSVASVGSVYSVGIVDSMVGENKGKLSHCGRMDGSVWTIR